MAYPTTPFLALFYLHLRSLPTAYQQGHHCPLNLLAIHHFCPSTMLWKRHSLFGGIIPHFSALLSKASCYERGQLTIFIGELCLPLWSSNHCESPSPQWQDWSKMNGCGAQPFVTKLIRLSLILSSKSFGKASSGSSHFFSTAQTEEWLGSFKVIMDFIS